MKKFIGLLSLVILCTSCVYSGGHPGRWSGAVCSFGGLISWFLLIAVVALIIYLIVRGQSSGTRETPLDILKKRYARGEISKEEFDRMKKDLED
jgi:putative membrane protein